MCRPGVAHLQAKEERLAELWLVRGAFHHPQAVCLVLITAIIHAIVVIVVAVRPMATLVLAVSFTLGLAAAGAGVGATTV